MAKMSEETKRNKLFINDVNNFQDSVLKLLKALDEDDLELSVNIRQKMNLVALDGAKLALAELLLMQTE